MGKEKGFTLIELSVIIIIVAIFSVGFLGSIFPFQILFNLFFGWLFFIIKVLNYISVNPSLIVEGILSLIIFTAGIHWFLSWFYISYNQTKKWRWQWSCIAVTIFVLMFSISISVTGLIHEISWLIKTPITTMDFSPTATKNILENMGKGLLLYQQENNHIPIALKPIEFKKLKVPKKYYDGYLIDQWGRAIFYTSDGDSFVLKSYGRDGILGGEKYVDDLIFFSDKPEEVFYRH